MLLYRIIPDNWGYFLDRGHINLQDGFTTEDLLYDLGYINISEHYPYLPITTDPFLGAHNWSDDTGPGIYFFTSPWDAVKASRCISIHSTFFSDRGVRICEYDFPDEIISQSWSGEGYYKGIPRTEVKIPQELILNNPQTIISEELERQMSDISLLQAEESWSKLESRFIKEYSELTQEQIERVKQSVVSKESQDKFNKSRFKNIGVFQKSPYITGRRFYITRYDYSNTSRKDGYHLEELIPISNGILTEENLEKHKIKKNSPNLQNLVGR